MEHDLIELWPLLSISAPRLFPSPTRFRECYALPIEKHGDIADLPAKQEQVLEVELHPRHRKIYQAQLPA
ncbi:hypothetical protein AB0A74_24710 [Saccharothrix sp. NPDC042600]|uniref:hypothetical protein n=1 Tax=Saccharothrix TaxID=2071 RepID=UPI0033E88C16|nr:hypothetical protein GCM10017745_18130 [Saccharothrix mutabilis subsp. capreolus]